MPIIKVAIRLHNYNVINEKSIKILIFFRKHYLKVEKEFLQAKIQLQKEKEKKELLTEHLCALITHNETRKAKKLETLMLELASDKAEINNIKNITPDDVWSTDDDEKPVIVDGVDQKTGKIVAFSES